MHKFINFLEQKLVPFSSRFARQRHLAAIRSTFMTILPILLFGGLIAVINSAPVVEGSTNAFILAWASFVSKYSAVLGWLNAVTMGMMSLYACLGITYYLCKHYKEEPFIPMLLSLAGFTMLAADPQEIVYGSLLAQLTYFDGKGLLVAIFVSIITVEIYHFMISRNIGRIKMGENIPEALTLSFSSMLPALVILLIYGILYAIFHANGTTMAAWVSTLFAPALAAADSIWYVMFIALLLNFSWFFGIHNTVYSLLTDPIEYGNLSLNAAAFAAGTSLPCVFTVSFWCYFGIIGGLGNCLAVSILCLTSKVKEFRTIGRLGVVPAFFGISEPITFGLPIMLNPLMLIPCSLTSVVNVALAFLAMSSNLVGRTYTMLSYNMPSIFGAFFSTGDFKAVILIVVLLVLDLLIYFPFFKAYEKQFLREEEAAAKA